MDNKSVQSPAPQRVSGAQELPKHYYKFVTRVLNLAGRLHFEHTCQKIENLFRFPEGLFS